MVSLRQKRCSNDIEEFSSDSDYEYNPYRKDDSNYKQNPRNMSIKKAKFSFPYSNSENEKYSESGRRQKCFSKNALMARENRIKKKIYVQNLEESVEKFRDENKKLNSILDNQSAVISDLRKEVKYLKTVLANKTDIGRLLTCINQNTGMPATTSLNNNIKLDKQLHPWAEESPINIDGELSTLLSDFEHDSNWNDLFSDISPSFDELPKEIPNEHLEHNYTNIKNEEEDVGVCLHIANHKVSLEFCSSCSENASSAWKID